MFNQTANTFERCYDINNGILHDQFVQKQNHIIFCGFFEYFKA